MSWLQGVARNARWSLHSRRTDFRALREVSLGRSAKKNPKINELSVRLSNLVE